MKIRTKGINPTQIARLSKEEWEKIKAAGTEFFEKRKVGYAVITDGITFEKLSSYYREFKEKDDKDVE